MNTPKQPSPTRQAVEIAVNLGLIFLIVAWCVQILAPFLNFIIWGAVIAISTYRPFCSMRNRLGGKAAVLLFSIIGLGLVIGPAWMFGGSLVESAKDLHEAVETGTFDIAPPDESVQDWPLVGTKVYAAWDSAATNFEDFLEDYSEQLRSVAEFAIEKVKGLGLTVLLFVLAVLIAAAMLTKDEATIDSLRRFFRRLVGDRADEVLNLSVATIRSVTMGVLGIAFIQAVLLGGGMLVVGVPAAGVLALVVLVLVIAQLPALIVMAPVIAWVFSAESTLVAVVFAIYSILGSMSDMVLKPLLLGRGVDAPMLVVLLGAIGGMIMGGILGLFVGAVVLTLGYKLYQAWLEMDEEPDAPAMATMPEPD